MLENIVAGSRIIWPKVKILYGGKLEELYLMQFNNAYFLKKKKEDLSPLNC